MKLKNCLKLVFCFLTIHFFIACGGDDDSDGHGHKKGSIVSSDGNGFAKACEENQDIKLGDKLKVYESICLSTGKRSAKSSGSRKNCTKLFKGQAEIIEILDQHFSKIRASGTFNLKVGEITEKI